MRKKSNSVDDSFSENTVVIVKQFIKWLGSINLIYILNQTRVIIQTLEHLDVIENFEGFFTQRKTQKQESNNKTNHLEPEQVRIMK